ncbi:protein MAIN-LIKE 2-like [Amaranthus tricolor]|uniref:protein MAIN-LIKE 2-like n=1 Tax=Amaranthus tricolor TaxID=29722 RepID=UPI0025872BE2|nr:protein MAIN-LIKE 2-like [Amaranthus tricolor]
MNRKENYEITELRLGFQMNIQLQQQTIKKQPFSMMFQGPEPAPLDWTIVRGPEGRFARGGPSSSAASERTWIYEYFPAFRPHPRRDDVPNTTRAEMWTPKKVGRELDRLISFRKVLDSMTETQVEWTPYNCGAAALLNEHPRTTVIGGITCFDVVEVYLPERALRQIGFVQSIPPAPMRPAKALRPAHGTYSVTFPSSAAAFVEAWSRFPYSD